MAVITNALLGALRTEVRRNFRDAYEAMQATSFYRDVAMIAPSSSASNTYDWLGNFPELREWVGDRVVKDIKENAYQLTNKLGYQTDLSYRLSAREGGAFNWDWSHEPQAPAAEPEPEAEEDEPPALD